MTKMAQMISAKYAEEVICKELGVNHTQGIYLQKMSVDSKTVKATAVVGDVDVEFTLKSEFSNFKVTGKNIPGDLYLRFDKNMKSMVRDIFEQDGGLFDEEDYYVEEMQQESIQLDEPQRQEDEVTETIVEIAENNAQLTEVIADEEQYLEKEETVTSENTEENKTKNELHVAEINGTNLEMDSKEIESIVDDILGTDETEVDLSGLWTSTI